MRSTLLAVLMLGIVAPLGGPAARAADPLTAKADPIAGKAIFEHTCANCHSLDVGVNKVGPSLWHVVNRPSGTIEGYDYSLAMKNLNAVWTPEALNVYLQNPRGDVHGVKMFFKGLPDPKDRADVIAYLEGFL
jgi:cytochrome c